MTNSRFSRLGTAIGISLVLGAVSSLSAQTLPATAPRSEASPAR
jgi:hypothetical protein